jgi:hypothetical protein
MARRSCPVNIDRYTRVVLDKSLRIVDVEGKAPEHPKVKSHIRWP